MKERRRFEGCMIVIDSQNVCMTNLKKGDMFLVEKYSSKPGQWLDLEYELCECESVFYWELQTNDGDPIKYTPGYVYTKEGRFEASLCYKVYDIE